METGRVGRGRRETAPQFGSYRGGMTTPDALIARSSFPRPPPMTEVGVSFTPKAPRGPGVSSAFLILATVGGALELGVAYLLFAFFWICFAVPVGVCASLSGLMVLTSLVGVLSIVLAFLTTERPQLIRWAGATILAMSLTTFVAIVGLMLAYDAGLLLGATTLLVPFFLPSIIGGALGLASRARAPTAWAAPI